VGPRGGAPASSPGRAAGQVRTCAGRPLCRCITQWTTASPCHCVTMSLQALPLAEANIPDHGLALSLCHSCHCVTRVTVSLVSLCRNVTVSLVSLCHNVPVSQCHCTHGSCRGQHPGPRARPVTVSTRVPVSQCHCTHGSCRGQHPGPRARPVTVSLVSLCHNVPVSQCHRTHGSCRGQHPGPRARPCHCVTRVPVSQCHCTHGSCRGQHPGPRARPVTVSLVSLCHIVTALLALAEANIPDHGLALSLCHSCPCVTSSLLSWLLQRPTSRTTGSWGPRRRCQPGCPRPALVSFWSTGGGGAGAAPGEGRHGAPLARRRGAAGPAPAGAGRAAAAGLCVLGDLHDFQVCRDPPVGFQPLPTSWVSLPPGPLPLRCCDAGFRLLHHWLPLTKALAPTRCDTRFVRLSRSGAGVVRGGVRGSSFRVRVGLPLPSSASGSGTSRPVQSLFKRDFRIGLPGASCGASASPAPPTPPTPPSTPPFPPPTPTPMDPHKPPGTPTTPSPPTAEAAPPAAAAAAAAAGATLTQTPTRAPSTTGTRRPTAADPRPTRAPPLGPGAPPTPPAAAPPPDQAQTTSWLLWLKCPGGLTCWLILGVRGGGRCYGGGLGDGPWVWAGRGGPA